MQILKKQRPDIQRRYVYMAALFFSFIVVLQVSNTNEENTLQIVLGHIVLFVSNYLCWAVMIDYIYGAVLPMDPLKKKRIETGLKIFFSLMILVLIHLVITNLIYYSFLIGTTNLTIDEAFYSFKPYVIKSILSRLLDLMIIISILKIIDTFQTVQKQKTQVVALENQLHISQLETLRSQLDPHFLFNTLHTLNALIGYDDVKARAMVIKVTNLLRKMLSQREKHLIAFEEELEYFKNYLDIEQERFYDRLEVVIEISEEAKSVMVPTLMLQPLIENAFKHGISLIEGDGIIKLSAKIENENLIVALRNTIPKTGQTSGVSSTKVGLNNLRNRLTQLFGDDYKLSTEKNEELFEVTIRITV